MVHACSASAMVLALSICRTGASVMADGSRLLVDASAVADEPTLPTDFLALKEKMVSSEVFVRKVDQMCGPDAGNLACRQQTTDGLFCQLLHRHSKELAAQACSSDRGDAAVPSLLEVSARSLRATGPKEGDLAQVGANVANGTSSKGPPCSCLAWHPSWSRAQRKVKKCVFIDLGAADGNTLQSWVNNKFMPTNKCPNGKWEAVLVEANPIFDMPLQALHKRFPGQLHLYKSTAAYMCKGQTSFDIHMNASKNYWGSRMTDQKAGKHRVTVPMVNLNRIIYEHTTPGDFVLVKMDIEGAEWDILPCLARSPAAKMVSKILIEYHNGPNYVGGMTGTTRAALNSAKASLRAQGVIVPDNYHSPTLF